MTTETNDNDDNGNNNNNKYTKNQPLIRGSIFLQ